MEFWSIGSFGVLGRWGSKYSDVPSSCLYFCFREMLERFDQVHHETRRGRAINYSMIVRKGERQHKSRLNFIVPNDRFHRTAPQTQDGNFGLIHNRGKMSAPDTSLVRN